MAYSPYCQSQVTSAVAQPNEINRFNNYGACRQLARTQTLYDPSAAMNAFEMTETVCSLSLPMIPKTLTYNVNSCACIQ